MQEKYQIDSDHQRDGDRQGSTDQCRCWDSVSNGYRKMVEANRRKLQKREVQLLVFKILYLRRLILRK